MWLSGILGHGVGSLIYQWGSTIKLSWVHTVTNWSVLVDRGIRTLVELNQWLKNWYSSLPSQVLGIIRIGQELVGSVSWLSGISGHDASGFASQWGRHNSVPVLIWPEMLPGRKTSTTNKHSPAEFPLNWAAQQHCASWRFIAPPPLVIWTSQESAPIKTSIEITNGRWYYLNPPRGKLITNQKKLKKLNTNISKISLWCE